MSLNPRTRHETAIAQREHEENQASKRVTPVARSGRSVSYEGSITVGTSVLDVNDDLGRNGVEGYIANDGAGSVLVEFSDDGTSFGGQHTLQTGEILSFDSLDVNQIRLEHVADTDYRVFVV